MAFVYARCLSSHQEYVIMIDIFLFYVLEYGICNHDSCLSSHLTYCNPGKIFFYARFFSSHLEYVTMINDMIFCTLGAWLSTHTLLSSPSYTYTSLSSTSKGLVKLTNGHVIVMSPMSPLESLWRKTFGLEEGQRTKRGLFWSLKSSEKRREF